MRKIIYKRHINHLNTFRGRYAGWLDVLVSGILAGSCPIYSLKYELQELKATYSLNN